LSIHSSEQQHGQYQRFEQIEKIAAPLKKVFFPQQSLEKFMTHFDLFFSFLQHRHGKGECIRHGMGRVR
jgi:hypothetical protein